MEGAAVQKIYDLAKKTTEPKEIAGIHYAPANWRRVTRPDPLPAPFKVHTLAGLVDYFKEGPEKLVNLPGHELAVHVMDPLHVAIIGALTATDLQRPAWAVAKARDLTSGVFGEFYGLEEFNILLQSRFVDGHDRANVLRVVGNVKEERVASMHDDGITQTVKARAGVATIEEVPVPNPVTLAPFRTFREVIQPASQFIFRMRSGGQGEGPTAGLFEADGGAWQLEAINAVAEFLRSLLPEGTLVIA